MKTVTLWTLLVLNAALLLSFFGLRIHENTARAQMAGTRRPGDYLMIDGQISGGNVGLVYVIDSVNGQLTAMTYANQGGNSSQIDSMAPIDLGAVFAQQVTSPSGVKAHK